LGVDHLTELAGRISLFATVTRQHCSAERASHGKAVVIPEEQSQFRQKQLSVR